MESCNNPAILRIYISTTDKHEHAPLYETLVFAAKKHGLAGATVIRGIMGYGASSTMQSSKWEINEKLPLIIEIIDNYEKINAFLQVVQSLFEKVRYGGMITVQKPDKMLIKKGEKK